MTYANDCIAMERKQRLRGLKRIEHHTDAELDEAIEKAHRKFGEDFYLLLQERRSRRKKSRLIKFTADDDFWRNS